MFPDLVRINVFTCLDLTIGSVYVVCGIPASGPLKWKKVLVDKK